MTITAKQLRDLLREELEREHWGTIDPWWLRDVHEGDALFYGENPEMIHRSSGGENYQHTVALHAVFERVAKRLNHAEAMR